MSSPQQVSAFVGRHLEAMRQCVVSCRRALDRGDHASADLAMMEALYEARLAQVQAAPIRNSTRTNEAHYSGAELAEPAVRQGADDHMRLPSRRGDSLYYRGGLVVDVEQINQETT